MPRLRSRSALLPQLLLLRTGRVLDKSRSNFCDFFSFKGGAKSSDPAASDAKDKLENLFKKG